MINKNVNLHLKLSKLDFNHPQTQPFTPIDQTLQTPSEIPNGNNINNISQQPSFFHSNNHSSSFYQNLNESDDILTDIDEPNAINMTKKNYTVYFTNAFDSLLMKSYCDMLSKPTTTPFSGTVPPSGLVGKVANEVILKLIQSLNDINPPLYDTQSIINKDCLKNQEYQPIILQLIRKRLLELCNKDTLMKLPDSTTVQGTNNNIKSNSISSMSLNEMNLMNYNSQQQSNNNSSSASSIRSRSSSLNLRKQSLTRNNSNNWLHVGNISSLRPPIHNEFNISTDSLQSIQDFVPQTLINRSTQQYPLQQQQQAANQSQLNSMMSDYHITPPTSHKSSISSINNNHNNNSSNQTFHSHNLQIQTPPEDQDFNFLRRSRSSSKGASALSLNINTHSQNTTSDQISLDSPFCSSTDEYFPGLQPQSQPQQAAEVDNENERSSLKNLFTLSEKKRDSLKLKRGIY